MEAVHLNQTPEVAKSTSLSCRHLPPNAFPVGPVYFTFKEDVTYIFLDKSRAFFARPFHAGEYVQPPFCPIARVDF